MIKLNKKVSTQYLDSALLDKMNYEKAEEVVDSPNFLSSSNTTADSQDIAKKTSEADSIIKMKRIKINKIQHSNKQKKNGNKGKKINEIESNKKGKKIKNA